MINTRTVVTCVAGAIIFGCISTVYLMKHPDINNINAVESSWLSQEEKDGAIKRIVSLACEQRFRQAFIPGTSVIPTGLVDEIVEQSDQYVYASDVAIINGTKAYSGRYLCTYYKDGKSPMLNVNMDGGVRDILKK